MKIRMALSRSSKEFRHCMLMAEVSLWGIPRQSSVHRGSTCTYIRHTTPTANKLSDSNTAARRLTTRRHVRKSWCAVVTPIVPKDGAPVSKSVDKIFCTFQIRIIILIRFLLRVLSVRASSFWIEFCSVWADDDVTPARSCAFNK